MMLTHKPATARNIGDTTRHVELDIDIGADAKDWSAIQATEKLKPVEADLRRMEEMVSEVVGEMDYLRTREQKLRDTNESTNNRVKWFGFCTTFILIVLWVWQILYLRAYFRFVFPALCLFYGVVLIIALSCSGPSTSSKERIRQARWFMIPGVHETYGWGKSSWSWSYGSYSDICTLDSGDTRNGG